MSGKIEDKSKKNNQGASDGNGANSARVVRDFKLSSFAIDNRISVFVIIFLIVIMGMISYASMPKENFPEIKIPEVYVNTVYPGNAPLDMENLVTRPLEKELNSITGVAEITSTSIADFSSISVEFDMDVDLKQAVLDVKDAVDRSKPELPEDLPSDPTVLKIDFANIPVMNINLSGFENIDLLKNYAEEIQEEIEKFKEVKEVKINGVQEKEVAIMVDPVLLEQRNMSFGDIAAAIGSENMTISGGEVLQDGVRRNVRVVGEFESVAELKNVIVKSEKGNIVYLRDIAEVKFQYEDKESYSRVFGQSVVSLDIMKRNGANLLETSDKVNAVLAKLGKTFPKQLEVKLINDTSKKTRSMLSNLENSIISGVILVVLVLLFFLGIRNALFVGVAIPLSMLMGFMFLSFTGSTLNFMVLFSLILALGMLVDNGIVVVENIYRLRQEGLSAIQASKEGVGEVATPIIASTLTTLAAFVPLLFWDSVFGEFMKYLPQTLIIVLSSSLFVALVVNPVLTSVFMKVDDPNAKLKYRNLLITFGIIATLIIGSHFAGFYLLRGILIALLLIIVLQSFVFRPLTKVFLVNVLPAIEKFYRSFVRLALTSSWRPILMLIFTCILLLGSNEFYQSTNPDNILFSKIDPNQVYVYAEYPVGTDIEKTNEITQQMEQIVMETIEPYGYMVESLMANVGKGTGDPQRGPNNSATPQKSRLTVFFLEFEKRRGVNTGKVLEKIRENLAEIPGMTIVVDQESSGPPTGPPINVEVIGEDYNTLISLAKEVKDYLENTGIEGAEELKLDLEESKPELVMNIDRDKVRRYGASTGMIADLIRTSIFGKEISKFKEGEDEYPINLRSSEDKRYDITKIMNQLITFRNQGTGQMVQLPLSALASPEYTATLGSVKRKDLDRVISIYSNVLEGYSSEQIVSAYADIMSDYELPEGYEVRFSGEQAEQAEVAAFLMKAGLISVFLIFLIIVSQFNSLITPFIIVASVIFSTVGVFFGYGIAKMDFVVLFTGIGIISLAGIVVNNAIVLIDYTNLVRSRMRRELDLPEDASLTRKQVIDSIVEAGSTRLRPVLLTAMTTILGLIPLAIGFNIDFRGLLTSLEPNIFIGGDNAAFWGPMAWAVIFGLTFSTFLTLVIVPVMYSVFDRSTFREIKKWFKARFKRKPKHPNPVLDGVA